MPVQGGLMNNRLGTLEPGQKCAPCGKDSAKCPGHCGHIELAEPVLHIAFVDDIHKLLLITCRSCNRIKLDVEELAHYKSSRDAKAAYAVITLENIKDDIIERAKKVKRSEEHTSELQSRQYLVCRLLLEKKKTPYPHTPSRSSTTSLASASTRASTTSTINSRGPTLHSLSTSRLTP